GIHNIAGDGSLLLVCAQDGTLEGIRDGAVVLRRRCQQTLSPEMMAVGGDDFAALTEPRVLTVSRAGKTMDIATEISGEYELGMSSGGVVAMAAYALDGKPWFVRPGSGEIEPGPTHSGGLYSVAARGPIAAWGYRDGMVTAMDTAT